MLKSKKITTAVIAALVVASGITATVLFSQPSKNTITNSGLVYDKISNSDVQHNEHVLPDKDGIVMLEGEEYKMHYKGAVIEALGDKLSSFGVYYDPSNLVVNEQSDKLVLLPVQYTEKEKKNPDVSLTIVQSTEAPEEAFKSEKARMKKDGAKKFTDDPYETGELMVIADWNKKDLDGSRAETVIVLPNKNGGSICARIRFIDNPDYIEGWHSVLMQMINEIVIFED